jgi:hypothetical protein
MVHRLCHNAALLEVDLTLLDVFIGDPQRPEAIESLRLELVEVGWVVVSVIKYLQPVILLQA